MLPEGVSCEAGWLDEAVTTCFQVMDAADRAILDECIAKWIDLVEFYVVPALTSHEFWGGRW